MDTPTLNDAVIEEAIARYWREHDRYVKLATRVGDICRALVAENTIRAQVTYRAKEPDSLRGKLRKYKASEVESRLLTTPEAIFARVGDLAGVRIATYEERDREAVTRLLEGAFAGPGSEAAPRVEVKNKHEVERSNFYRATHCQVVLPAEELVGLYDNLKGLSCEVQVCSMLAHVWNEIEHDLRYKQLSGRLSADEQELIQQLGHLTIAGDTTIRLLIAAVDKRQQSQQGEFTDAFDFVARLRDKYPPLTDFGRHAQQLYEELRARGLHSPAKVEEQFAGERIEELQAAVDEFHQWLQSNDGYRESGHLARKGADVLLMALLRNSSQEILNRHPAGRGQGRPPRIAWLARRYLEMRAAAGSQNLQIGRGIVPVVERHPTQA
jgi:ppGpp synthetase/RelA/SpoT-type nucleotidyltranferase